MDIDSFLYRFCAHVSMWESLALPFEQGDCVCATDTQVLLCVPKPLVVYNYRKSDKPNLDEMIPAYDPDFSFHRKDLEDALFRADIELDELNVDCEECNGSGDVYWDYTDRYGDGYQIKGDCPVCHGDGYVRNGSDKFLNIANYEFEASDLLLLYHVMKETDTKVALVSRGDRSRFRFDLKNGVKVVAIAQCDLECKYPSVEVDPIEK